MRLVRLFSILPERRLTRNGRRVAVPAKAWQILLLLAEAGGRLIPHETFRARLWSNVVVEDRTLTVHMSTLRKALGEGVQQPILDYVARTGYRLGVPVCASCHGLIGRRQPPPRCRHRRTARLPCGASRRLTSPKPTAISASASPMP